MMLYNMVAWSFKQKVPRKVTRLAGRLIGLCRVVLL